MFQLQRSPDTDTCAFCGKTGTVRVRGKSRCAVRSSNPWLLSISSFFRGCNGELVLHLDAAYFLWGPALCSFYLLDTLQHT